MDDPRLKRQRNSKRTPTAGTNDVAESSGESLPAMPSRVVVGSRVVPENGPLASDRQCRPLLESSFYEEWIPHEPDAYASSDVEST